VLVVPQAAEPGAADDWAGLAGAVPVLRVRSKLDLGRAGDATDLPVSARTGEGMAALSAQVAKFLWGGAAFAAFAASDRQADTLRRAVEALERARAATQESALEVVSGEVGLALSALGEITGETASDALLDAIFRRFCIGK
jgi:tRNA modification GTPase